MATDDGLLPSRRLSEAIADSASAAARLHSSRASKRSPFSDELLTSAFLSEFAPFRDSHSLVPLDTSDISAHSLDSALSAIADGSLEPYCDDDDEPKWAEAMASPEREFWIAGARDELRSLEDLQVFVLVPRSSLPKGRRPLKGKLVCKRKRDDTGKVTRYKVRYVAKGFAQIPGIDYDKTTAPTARLESLRVIAHIAASLNWELHQFDIKTAFLNGILPEHEQQYMEQPHGFEVPGKEDWVYHLMKSIYGMKQASRVWNITFNGAIVSWGFVRLSCEWCVYFRSSPSGTVIFSVHVDDIFAAASSHEEMEAFKSLLQTKWEISDLGPAKFALGIAIARDRPSRTITLSQTAYINRLISRFEIGDARTADTPMIAGLQLRRPDDSAPVAPEIIKWRQQTPYRELVGSLMYLAVATRPDIAFAVGRLSSFLDCYTPEHWSAAVRVLRYLKGSRSLSLTLGCDRTPSLVGYSDSDYANCLDTSRSISGHCHSLGAGMVSWSSKKQKVVADSSCYAEYIALHDASHETIFLRQLLEGLGLAQPNPTTLHCDNDAASRLAEDHIWHPQVKHIRVKYHSVRELVANSELTVTRVRSCDNTADILTKPLARPDFLRLRNYLGLREPRTTESAHAM
jgi:hypothetical protein